MNMNTQISTLNGEFKLKTLSEYGNELSKTQPTGMYIENEKIYVKSWTDVTMFFVEYLITNGDLKQENLPFCLWRSRLSKEFINKTGKPSSGSDGYFKKVKDGFFVDTKYNAKSHILNMIATLDKLSITNKYSIRIVVCQK